MLGARHLVILNRRLQWFDLSFLVSLFCGKLPLVSPCEVIACRTGTRLQGKSVESVLPSVQ